MRKENKMNIEERLKAVTQRAPIEIYSADWMIVGLIADQRVIAYKDALRICKEIVGEVEPINNEEKPVSHVKFEKYNGKQK